MVHSPNDELLDLANIYDLDIDHIETDDYDMDDVVINGLESGKESHDMFD